MNATPIDAHLAHLIGYSERGLVNALVGFLRRDTKRLAQFIATCRWSGETPKQTGDLHDRLETAPPDGVTYLVEPGFAQFGDPDLIVVVRLGEDVWRLFVEAKVVSYAASAMSNAAGMGEPGFNSSINGQLSLRYRLARALADGAPTCNGLEEPESLRKEAKSALGDKVARPRHLSKEGNLGHLVPVLRPVDVPTAPIAFMEKTFFVALTREGEPPAGFPADRDRWPCYFEGENKALADGAWSRTAICDWGSLQERIPGLAGDADFESVWDVLALKQSSPKRTTGVVRTIQSTAWTTFDASSWLPQARQDVSRILDEIGTALSGRGSLTVVAQQGSDTWRLDGAAVAKVMAHGTRTAPELLVGVASDQSVAVPPLFVAAEVINRRAFHFVALREPPSPATLDVLRPALEEYLEELLRTR